ncbi:unnamed protein product [Coregonus sp. 'balchen']|nr:unnamed protein product [Coregonus sp. 'balchen']
MAVHTREAKLELVTKHIKHFPDFPSKGIIFRDICPILKDPGALTAKGKLPGPTVSVAYTLEYGKVKLAGDDRCITSYTFLSAEDDIQEDAVAPGQKLLLIDDLLATGGTLYAACELMKKQNAEVMGCMVVIELNRVEKLKPNTLFSLVQY